jgi:predicted nucleotidyltransferase
MSNISNPLQLRADRPIEPAKYAALAVIDGILTRLQCPYMLVGALARDILLYNVFGQPIYRSTQDVDIAILIDSWERFQAVKSDFLQNPDFQPHPSKPYRVMYRPPASDYPIPVDILPFGEIATEAELFRWPPPDTDLSMNVMAFADAYASAVTVTIGPGFNLKIASIPGLVLLKLLAWVDRRESRDAQDVLHLIEAYGDSGNEDRLYGDEADLLEAAKYDFSLAGSRLLAKDAFALAAPSTVEVICSLFRDPKRLNTFQSQMTSLRLRLDDSIPDHSGIRFEAFVETFLSC